MKQTLMLDRRKQSRFKSESGINMVMLYSSYFITKDDCLEPSESLISAS